MTTVVRAAGAPQHDSPARPGPPPIPSHVRLSSRHGAWANTVAVGTIAIRERIARPIPDRVAHRSRGASGDVGAARSSADWLPPSGTAFGPYGGTHAVQGENAASCLPRIARRGSTWQSGPERGNRSFREAVRFLIREWLAIPFGFRSAILAAVIFGFWAF